VYRLYEHHDESAALAQQALADAERLDDLAGIIDALNNLGNLYGGLGDYHKSLDYFQRALDIATARSAPPDMTALAQFGVGLALHSLGDFDGADRHYQECLALCYLSGDSRRENALLTNIGVLKGQRGDYDGEIECYRRCLEIDRSMGNVRGEALALLNIGITLYNLHRYDESADYLEQARALARRIEQPRVEAPALQNLARIEQQRGNLDAAADAFQASIDITTAVHDLENTTMNLILLGLLEVERGNLDAARSLTERAEQLAIELDNPIFTARAHGVLGKIAVAEALLLEHDERHERLQRALARFDSSITMLREIGHSEWQHWQTERDAVAAIEQE
jgi:tetratricopeptide (TPR) repeat protein